MQKQKKGFLLFISSLIPGAGEMYMGFFKQGISIMTLFWAIIAIAGGLNISSLVIFLPVIWFYSYFHVHNLKELPEEEFYAIEDSYIFHLDQIFSGFHNTSSRQLKAASILLILRSRDRLERCQRSALLDSSRLPWRPCTKYYVSDSIYCHRTSDHPRRLSDSYRKSKIFPEAARGYHQCPY